MDYSILDGPGAHLTNGIFLGDTVARETFVTQFVQDISSAANISPSRVFVMEIAPGWIHHDWEVRPVSPLVPGRTAARRQSSSKVFIFYALIPDHIVGGSSSAETPAPHALHLPLQTLACNFRLAC